MMSKKRVTTNDLKELMATLSAMFERDEHSINLSISDLRRGEVKLPDSILSTNLPVPKNSQIIVEITFKNPKLSSTSTSAILSLADKNPNIFLNKKISKNMNSLLINGNIAITPESAIL